MPKKKLLHVTYDMNIGGTEQVIKNLIDGLNPDRFQSSVLCVDGAIGPWGKELQSRGVEHYCFQRQPGFDLALIKRIRKLVLDERFDIIHAHQYTPYTYGWFGSVLTGVPIIFTEHGRFYPDFSSAKRKLINPLLQMRTAAITAISDATRKALVEFENLSASKIEVIYNGISDCITHYDQALAESLGLNEGAVVFGTISRLDPIKNQVMMIKAFARYLEKNSDARLLIVGDGPIRAELEQLVASLDIAAAVCFTGFQSKPQSYLALMDVFLLPSLSEGTSMTLLEAMSFSKPTIATAVGGTPEIVVDGESGRLIPNQDEAALVAAMDELGRSSDLRLQMGAQARCSYEKMFTLPTMVAHYESLYERLC